MHRELPHLEFLPINRLIIHEWHDNQRTPPLIRRIRESGLWRNPPIVAPLLDDPSRYMVLDGANRYTATSQMGFRDILVQVVEPDSPGLRLQNWNHVVWGMSQGEFLDEIHKIPGLELVPASPQVEPDLFGSCGLALIDLPGDEVFSLCTDITDLLQRVVMLNAVVNSYKDRGSLDRSSARDIHRLKGYYPDLCGLVVFPNFTIKDVMSLAASGYLLPTGITRFTITPRALHLNYPLEELASTKPIEQKNEQLKTWIQSRIANKGVRYYAEPTFLFDE